jgi:MFS family permease
LWTIPFTLRLFALERPPAMIGLLARLLPYWLSFFGSFCIMILELVASRLVVRHVGLSLVVWTSVIGVILAGICLGNVLGGRLADRVPPRRAVGALYAGGAALTVAILWINAAIGLLPGLDSLHWNLRTVIVVTLDFLVPATVLGMISPVVAKMAVEQARRSGSAIGDVYFWGAVGSIAGTFLAGYWLLGVSPTTAIVGVVAAGLALLAGLLGPGLPTRVLGLGASVALILGVLEPMGLMPGLPGIVLGEAKLNALAVLGQALAIGAGLAALVDLRRAFAESPLAPAVKPAPVADIETLAAETVAESTRVRLGDLAALAFLASLAFMALEMVAGRLVARHLGSSIFGWTSVIGVLLGGLSIGNWLGGKIADRVTSEKQASLLFLIASVCVLMILLAESPPKWLVRNPLGYFFNGDAPVPLIGDGTEYLRNAPGMHGFPWWFRVLFWVGVEFLVPAISLGTVSPVVAKLAVDRVRRTGRTGTAIGAVYAWGMVGSLVGTFLAGFLLIDVLGTKGLILALATMLALAATALGTIWHAAWAGVPLGLCVIAFGAALLPAGWRVPLPGKRVLDSDEMRKFLVKQGVDWGLREPAGDPNDVASRIAYVDESNYYYIKVNNELRDEGIKRTLVLDNLIHGYEILGRPERLDYDYEHIYGLVTHRVLQEKAKRTGAAGPRETELGTLFLGGGSYTFPRYLQAVYPKTWAQVAEIDPAVTHANHVALGLPWPEPGFPRPRTDPKTGREVVTIQRRTYELGAPGSAESQAAYFGLLRGVAPPTDGHSPPPVAPLPPPALVPPMRRDAGTGQAVVTLDGAEVPLGPFGSEASQQAYLDAVARWFENSKYRIRTDWGDARQFVVKHPGLGADIVYGDAFNDFSVPWHLTTLQFNERLKGLMTDDGVYMINIIDAYETDEHAATRGPRRAMRDRVAGALRAHWSGEETADHLARDFVAEVADPTVPDPARPGAPEPVSLAARWAHLGARADKALSADPRPLSTGAVAAAIRRTPAEPADSGAAGPSRDSLDVNAKAILMRARSTEVLKALEHARDGVFRRAEGDDTPSVRSALLATVRGIESARGLALEEPTARKRADAIEASLAWQARAAARAATDTADELVDAARDEMLREYEQQSRQEGVDKATLDLRARGVIELLETIALTQAQQTAGSNDPAERARAREVARHAAARASNELERVRREVARDYAEIARRAENDNAAAEAMVAAAEAYIARPDAWIDDAARAVNDARELGGFLASWVNTARKTFPHIYVYGTHLEKGNGVRETFVVVASLKPLDLDDLGQRPGDPDLRDQNGIRTIPKVYDEADMKALAIRSRGIVLTDDYAPVENLLARVAESRAED